MVQPLPAFQKRWMPVATMVSPAIAIRSVSAGPFTCVAEHRLERESAGRGVLSQDAIAERDRFDLSGPPDRLDQGAGGEAGMVRGNDVRKRHEIGERGLVRVCVTVIETSPS